MKTKNLFNKLTLQLVFEFDNLRLSCLSRPTGEQTYADEMSGFSKSVSPLYARLSSIELRSRAVPSLSTVLSKDIFPFLARHLPFWLLSKISVEVFDFELFIESDWKQFWTAKINQPYQNLLQILPQHFSTGVSHLSNASHPDENHSSPMLLPIVLQSSEIPWYPSNMDHVCPPSSAKKKRRRLSAASFTRLSASTRSFLFENKRESIVNRRQSVDIKTEDAEFSNENDNSFRIARSSALDQLGTYSQPMASQNCSPLPQLRDVLEDLL